MAVPLEYAPGEYGSSIASYTRQIDAAHQAQERAKEARKQDEQRKAFAEQVYNGHKIPAPIAAEIVKNVAVMERARAEERLDIAHEMAGLPISPESVIKTLTSLNEMDKDLLQGKGDTKSKTLDPKDPKAQEIEAMKRYIQFYYSPEFKGPIDTAEDLQIQNTKYKVAKQNLACVRDQEAEGATLGASTYQQVPDWEQTILNAENQLRAYAKPIEAALLAPHRDRIDNIDERIADAEALFDYASNDMPCITFGKAGTFRGAPNDCSVTDWVNQLNAVVEQGIHQDGVADLQSKLKNEFVRHAQYMIRNKLDYKKNADQVKFNDGRNYDPDEPYPTRQYGQVANGLDRAAANGLDTKAVATDETAEQTAAAAEGNAKWADTIDEGRMTQNNQMTV